LDHCSSEKTDLEGQLKRERDYVKRLEAKIGMTARDLGLAEKSTALAQRVAQLKVRARVCGGARPEC
jgi:hypothetical protein